MSTIQVIELSDRIRGSKVLNGLWVEIVKGSSLQCISSRILYRASGGGFIILLLLQKVDATTLYPLEFE